MNKIISIFFQGIASIGCKMLAILFRPQSAEYIYLPCRLLKAAIPVCPADIRLNSATTVSTGSLRISTTLSQCSSAVNFLCVFTVMTPSWLPSAMPALLSVTSEYTEPVNIPENIILVSSNFKRPNARHFSTGVSVFHFLYDEFNGWANFAARQFRSTKLKLSSGGVLKGYRELWKLEILAISFGWLSSTACILLYELIMVCLWPNHGGWELLNLHGAGTCVCPIKYRSRNKHRNL